jgi:hypothetical protein
MYYISTLLWCLLTEIQIRVFLWQDTIKFKKCIDMSVYSEHIFTGSDDTFEIAKVTILNQ